MILQKTEEVQTTSQIGASFVEGVHQTPYPQEYPNFILLSSQTFKIFYYSTFLASLTLFIIFISFSTYAFHYLSSKLYFQNAKFQISFICLRSNKSASKQIQIIIQRETVKSYQNLFIYGSKIFVFCLQSSNIIKSNQMKTVLIIFLLFNLAFLRHLEIVNDLADNPPPQKTDQPNLNPKQPSEEDQGLIVDHLANAASIMPSLRSEPFLQSSRIMGQREVLTNFDTFRDIGLTVPSGRENDIIFKKIRNSGPPTSISQELFQLRKFTRQISGSGNNQRRRQMGSVNSTQIRKCRANYLDRDSQPIRGLPNPREISNQVGTARPNIQLNKENVTFLFTIWGQFIDHDMQQAPTNPSRRMNIAIPRCDFFLDIDCNGGREIPFLRSITDPISSPKTPINSITSWIDASMVYGNTQNQARRLRSFVSGKLKSRGVGSQQLLPGGAQIRNSIFSNIFSTQVDAGDGRATENLVLLSFHTIFLRQHNRICDLIQEKNRFLADNQIYTIAKNYVTALIQKITYDDFLPILLGKQAYNRFIGDYSGYSENTDASLTVQFSTAGYRFGHSLLVPRLPLINAFGDKFLSLSLDNVFFRPELLDSFNVERVLKGASRTIAKLRDGQFIDEVRNLLVISHELRNIKMDLLAINIQRGRDHGLPSYNSMRQCYGLRRLRNFNEISEQSLKNEQIRSAYGDIQNVDSYVGIQAERSVAGSVLGETGIEIVGEQFQRIRAADRFWYERSFPQQIINQIKATKLSHVILRNTDIVELQQDVFRFAFGG